MIRPSSLRAPEASRRLGAQAGPVPAGPPTDLESCLAAGTLLLRRAGIATARLDAECLMAQVLACARWRLMVEPRRRLTRVERARFRSLLRRRSQREPLAYVAGRREFWSLTLSVPSGVFIPRPETETLVEQALEAVGEIRRPAGSPPILVDVGTGSGAIAIALAREIPDARVIATDISPRALRAARVNAIASGVGDRITFLRGDGWQPLRGGRAGWNLADVVLANPPYIPSAAIKTLMPEVQWEPRRALDGGRDGLRVLREVIRGAPGHVRPGGFLLVEIGADQAGAVRDLVESAGSFEALRVCQDLAGQDRVVVARRRPQGNARLTTDN